MMEVVLATYDMVLMVLVKFDEPSYIEWDKFSSVEKAQVNKEATSGTC